jgi:GNAT superfamily N-acetyltransferase
MRAGAFARQPRFCERDLMFRTGDVADLPTLLAIDLDASVLFERAGLYLDLPETHDYSVRERQRLGASLIAGSAIIAMDRCNRAMGFIALGRLDGECYVEQISVRVSEMRRGLGTALMEVAGQSLASSDEGAWWLTTYDHLPWNRPFYERNGFVAVPEHECGRGIREELEFQRRWLPQPAKRIAMRAVLK